MGAHGPVDPDLRTKNQADKNQKTQKRKNDHGVLLYVRLKGDCKPYMIHPMKYLHCDTTNRVSILDMNMPEPGPGEIIVRLSLCGICGTDISKVFDTYPKPQKLGHEVVGVVHAVGTGIRHFAAGQRVALAHHAADPSSHYSTRGSETMDPQFKRSNIHPGGFAEFICVPAALVDNTVMPVPENMPDERAVFMEPMACCLRALDRVVFRAGDSCLVIGVGAVGILFVPLLRDLGVSVIAADTRRQRNDLAMRWGAVAGGVPGTDEIVALSKQYSAGHGVDGVILTAVNPSTLALAMDAVRDGGSIVIFGGTTGMTAEINMWDVWRREINLVSSYSATPDGLKRAINILAGHGYDGLEDLVSHRMPLAEAQSAFEMVKQGRASKVVLTP
jgi:L-iditol 2-dehydrogenase